MYQQHNPFSVKVEFTEGCNLRCPFCGINGIRGEKRTYEYMPPSTASTIGKQIKAAGWRPRLEFSGRGEPSHNPQVLECIGALRRNLPDSNFMMTTNGSGFLAKSSAAMANKVIEYFEAGMSTVALDEYQNVPWAQQVREALKAERKRLSKAGIDVYEYPSNKEGNPHYRNAPNERRFSFIAPIDAATNGNHSYLNNQCGAAGPLDNRMDGKRCARPFREIVVRYDGNVALCCNDWRGQFKAGNIFTATIDAIWLGDAFNAARRKLLYGQRDFVPCLGCTARSYRNGLLPDPSGKETLPPADKNCQRIIDQVTSGVSYTVPVAREWDSLVQIRAMTGARTVGVSV